MRIISRSIRLWASVSGTTGAAATEPSSAKLNSGSERDLEAATASVRERRRGGPGDLDRVRDRLRRGLAAGEDPVEGVVVQPRVGADRER